MTPKKKKVIERTTPGVESQCKLWALGDVIRICQCNTLVDFNKRHYFGAGSGRGHVGYDHVREAARIGTEYVETIFCSILS